MELLPHRDDIQHASTMIKRALWPDGFGMDFRINHGLATLRRIVRQPYPFPMYCSLRTIGGPEQDRSLGGALLDFHKENAWTIALWTLGRPDRVYGQCNFTDPSAQFDLKFCGQYPNSFSRPTCVFLWRTMTLSDYCF